MTVTEASVKWKVSEKTVLSYISNGWICDLQAQGNQLILPDIPKPYRVTMTKKLSVQENIYRNILRATGDLKYISCYMLNVSQESFETALNILTTEGYIVSSRPQTNTNVGYSATPKGLQFIKENNYTNFTANLSLMSGNIGLVNLG